jgi:uncharacterized protein
MIHWLRRIGICLVLIYLGLILVLYGLQDYLIFPGRETQGTNRAIIRESTAYELVHLTTRSGDKTLALFGSAQDSDGRPLPDAAKRPTILFFYGNAMCLSDCFTQLAMFRKFGLNVMIPEYVGYGLASGKSSEASLYETADAAYDALQTRGDIDPHKIIAAGWSLGAAVAVDLAHRRPVIGLATFSAFTNIKAMTGQVVPWLPIPVTILRHRFDNLSKIADITCPIFIAHGLHDSIVPVGMHKQLLSAAVRSKDVTEVTPDSDHNDLLECADELWSPFLDWIAGL